jgi:prepilin-type processing-associated H-X9-DG protein
MVELLVVMAVIGILAAILLPAVLRARLPANRAKCVSNLRQIGLSYRVWANDHESKLPMQLSVTNGGTFEFTRTPQAFRHVQVLSNILQMPKVLICPADVRQPATDWVAMRNRNLSYLIGVEATLDNPMSLLAADRNISRVALPNASLVLVNASAHWTELQHKGKGNVLLSDGSVQQTNDDQLQQALAASFRPPEETR